MKKRDRMPAPHIVTVGDNVPWINDSSRGNDSDRNSSYRNDLIKHLHSSEESLDEATSKLTALQQHSLNSIALPPLRIHSPRGRELDTDSVFQKNLRISKLCHMLGLPDSLVDWRFPKGHVPSRPDFSRNVPPPQFRHTAKSVPTFTSPSYDDDASTTVPSKYHVEVLL